MPVLLGFLLASSLNPTILTAHEYFPPIIEATTTPQDLWIDKLQKCENEHHVEKILDTNGYYSYGDYMFQMGTWLAYGKKFGATRENIGSSTLQRTVVRAMLDAGGQNHWFNCSWVTAKLGPYPVD